MKPRIRFDRFGSGWLCKLRGMRTATGETPAGAYRNWCALNRIPLLKFPVIDPSLLPEKERA